jgi:hypothetical protein
MISVNQSLIAEARGISYAISHSSCNVATKARDAGKAAAVVAAFITVQSQVFKNDFLFCTVFPTCLVFKNMYEMSCKLNKTGLKLVELENSELNKNSPDYIQATSARNFLVGVYKNIENHLNTIRKIDHLFLLGLLGSGALETMMYVNPLTSTLKSGDMASIQNHFTALRIIGYMVIAAAPIAAYGLYHRLRERTKLIHANQALTEEILKKL